MGLESSPGPRPQWELGQDQDQGPAWAGSQAHIRCNSKVFMMNFMINFMIKFMINTMNIRALVPVLAQLPLRPWAWAGFQAHFRYKLKMFMVLIMIFFP